MNPPFAGGDQQAAPEGGEEQQAVAESKKNLLKRIVAEEIAKMEIEAVQKEGLFGKLKAKLGFGSKNWERLTDKFEKESKRLYRSHFDMKTGAEMSAVVKAMIANFDQYMDALRDEDLTKDQQRGTDSALKMYRRELEDISDRASDYGARDAKEAAQEAARRARQEAEDYAEYQRKQRHRKAMDRRREIETGGSSSSEKKSGFDSWMSDEGDNYDYMTRMENLKKIVGEEVIKLAKENKRK